MKALRVDGFNLKATLESGQVFRYHKGSDGFYHVVAGDSIIRLQQKGDKLSYGCSNSEFNVAKFLGLTHSYSEIINSISHDEKIAAAIKEHYGLRIMEQGLWECTASFICSSFSNIPRIRQCIEKVAAAFGDEIELGSFKSFSFPQPEQVDDFSRLEKCGLGYRAKYLLNTAKMFSENSDSYSQQQLRKLGYEGAKNKLMELSGVGSKVADCILLFSCGFYEAFPVDVWIQRAMVESYGNELRKFAAAVKKRVSEPVVADFARSYFGSYAGYAQQFLYHHARNHANTEIRTAQALPILPR